MNEDSIKLHPEHGLNHTEPLCYICSMPKGSVMILGDSYEKKAPSAMYVDKMPCSECISTMEEHVIVIEIKDGEKGKDLPQKTGVIITITNEAATRLFPTHNIKENRFFFVEESLLKINRTPS